MTRATTLLLAMVAVLAGCGSDGSLHVDDAPAADAPPRDVALQEADWPQIAAWIARENDDGRPVVVNFFASWCEPCREEAPLLRDAMAEHPDVAFLGIAHQDRLEASAEFLEDAGLEFPTVSDPTGDVAPTLGSRGMPTTAYFDRTGRLVHTHTGIVTRDQLAERIAAIERSG